MKQKGKEKSKLSAYAIKVLNGMAQGLFASLLIGLIIKQIGTLTGLDILVTFGSGAQVLMGPAIGAAVAFSVGAPPLGIFASVAVGAIGAGTFTLVVAKPWHGSVNLLEPWLLHSWQLNSQSF